MSLETAEARIKAQIWQAIAQDELNLDDVPKESLAGLVNLVTEAAVMAMDKDLAESNQAVMPAQLTPDPFDGIEEVLWQGRPLLSIMKWFTVTDERIRITEGLLGKTHTDIELVRVQSMDHKQTFGERLMQVGDITIRSHDRKNPVIVLNNIANPEDVHEVLRRAVLKARSKHQLTYREEM